MGASPSSLKLPRQSRIRQSREFRAVRAQGTRLAQGCLIANWSVLKAGAPSRLGVITSRRVGPAHVRNHARRLLRESYRLHQHEFLKSADVVLVARPSIASKNFHQVERDYLVALRRARLLPAS
jgi:ribonuclease P protein component